MNCQLYYLELVNEGIERLLKICRMSSPGPGARSAYSLELKVAHNAPNFFGGAPLS
jgi:hypothetical protein